MSLIWEERQSPVTATTADEVRQIVADVRAKYGAEPTLIKAAPTGDQWSAQMLAGFNGDNGVVLYSGRDSNGVVYSHSAVPSNEEPVTYWFVNADEEFPPHSEVPADEVVAALIALMEGGPNMPKVIELRPWPKSSSGS